MARKELRKLQAVLDYLPNAYWDVLLMKKAEELSRREIAQRMEIGEDAVIYVYISRATLLL